MQGISVTADLDYTLLGRCIRQDFDPNEKRKPISKKLREKILERDKGCKICGFERFGEKLVKTPKKTYAYPCERMMRIHHICPKEESSEENLICVCLVCHDFVHSMQSRHVKGFQYHKPSR
jgi:hypothetical protein